MLTINDLDSTYIQLHFNDEDDYRKIYDFFSIRIPGSEFNPKVKAGIYDGKIKFLNAKNRLPFGLKEKLITFCKNNDIEYEDKTLSRESDITQEEFSEFISNIIRELPFKPYLHQLKIAYNCIKDQTGIGLAGTGAGKSLALYLIIRYYLWKGLNTYLIVPNIDLVLQMKGDLVGYYQDKEIDLIKKISIERDEITKASLQSELNFIYKNRENTDSLNFEDMISIIYGGQDKYQNKPITISTFASLDIANNRVNKEYFETVDVILIDEAHRASGNTLGDIISACSNSRVRYGVSGSLDTDIINNLKVEGLLGQVKKIISFNELAELGLVTATFIQPIYLMYNKETCKDIKKMKWAEQDKFIRTYKPRNNFISKLATSFLDENVLAICKNLDAGDDLVTRTANIKIQDFIKTESDIKKLQKLNESKVYYTRSSTKAKDREQFKQELENTVGNIYYAIDKIIGTGVSIKQLSRLIFTNIGKSLILILQAIGRGGRLHKNKDKTVIYDIVDQATYYSRTGKAYPNKHFEHFLERLEIYYQFDYNVLEPKKIQID